MRLRRVVLTGFKTFARRTEVLLGDGITAVVGPNGSGKSNLVDGIRWGLGETNARELRGLRMDEVIHATGPGRPPLGMAQVDLLVDNEDGRLPCEDVEVEISRRVTRSGESEFRLNGDRLRLRDLERILSATGLTQAGYAVVAQNDVDGIIEATPAQRRALIEEAAGVRGLRTAREDAMARVGGVEHSLLRLSDLLADAEPRLVALAEQATAALEQRELAARLAELRGSLAREEWRAARGAWRRARQRMEAARTRAAAAGEAQTGFTNRLEAERARLAAALRRRDAADRDLVDARLSAERALGERRRHRDLATSHGLQRAAAALEEAAARAELSARRATVTELGEADVQAVGVIEGLAARARALGADRTAAADAHSAAVAAAAGATAARSAAERRHAELLAAHQQRAARLAVLEEAVASLDAAALTARRRREELLVHAAAARGDADSAAAAAAAAAECAAVADRALGDARQAFAVAEEIRAAAIAELREAEARAAAIRGQMDGVLGGGPVAAAVAGGALEAARLVDRFTVRAEADAPAVEAALEHHLGAWVVGDLARAAALLDPTAHREELLGAELAAVDAEPQSPSLPAGARPALAAIDPHRAAAGALAHCLRGTWLAPDIAAARALVATGQALAVLPDGTVVSRAGIRGGGRPGAALSLAADGRAATAAVEALRADAAARDHALAAAADRQDALAAAANRAGVDAAQSRAVAGAAAAAATASTAAVTADEQHAQSIEQELEARRRAIAEARLAAEGTDRAVATAAAAVTGAAAVAGAAGSAAQAAATRRAAAEGAAREHEIEAARVEPEARALQGRLAGARAAATQAEERVRIAVLRRCAAEEAALAALARASDRSRAAARSQALVAAAQAASALLSAPLAALELSVAALDRERSEVAVAVARAGDELGAATAEARALEARVAELAAAVRGNELDEGPEPDAAAAERAEREIVRLERRVAALGPVNGLAPAQHAALEARTGGLRRDHDDLAGACADLRAVAEHLSSEIETRFSAVFGAVAYHFRLLFEELFSGGRATLRLEQAVGEQGDDEESRDTLRAPRAAAGVPGVEILAQPAGKRLVALSLLSGGERALTALAVILALQHVNPSPFYVFDEVDAPLDDANIGRFTRLLRRLAEHQQFLVVTHNHATMAAADTLYGVTMGDDGVSRLLSVRFGTGRPAPHRHEVTTAAAAS